MTSQELKKEIEIKRPRYLVKYTSLMEAISDKGSIKGGGYISFGAFYQTFMYAFTIGYRLGECVPLLDSGDKKDFAPFGDWKPIAVSEYILMCILNESEEKLGFSWIQLEQMDEETGKEAVSKIIRRIEGYANAGLDYLQKKFDEEKDEFRDPFVFVNFLRNI